MTKNTSRKILLASPEMKKEKKVVNYVENMLSKTWVRKKSDGMLEVSRGVYRVFHEVIITDLSNFVQTSTVTLDKVDEKWIKSFFKPHTWKSTASSISITVPIRLWMAQWHLGGSECTTLLREQLFYIWGTTCEEFSFSVESYRPWSWQWRQWNLDGCCVLVTHCSNKTLDL